MCIRDRGLIRRVHGNQGNAAFQLRSGEYVGVNVIGKRPYAVVSLSQKGNVDDILTLLAEVLDNPGFSQPPVSREDCRRGLSGFLIAFRQLGQFFGIQMD